MLVDETTDRVVVRVGAATDLATTPALADAVRRVERCRKHVVLDLAEAGFIDSSGLSVIMNCVRRVTAAGHHCLVVAPAGPVLRIIEMTGLTETFRVQSDLAAAHAVIDAAPLGPYRSSRVPPAATTTV